MARTSRFAALAALRKSRDFTKLLAMMMLSFLVIFVVGVMRPIRDAVALDGLEPGAFYQVYFVSAIVVLFVPLYNRIANRVRWKDLIPATALFFGGSLLVFRLFYTPGSALFGMAFYGWYDLIVSALVTQFFMATQLFFNARDAKRAYPLVIAAGSIGATVGGAVLAIFSRTVGTANLLFIPAVATVMFAIGIRLVWRTEDPDAGRTPRSVDDRNLSTGEFRRLFSNRQVQLIAATVLLTVLVKQFIDYQYKTLSSEVFTNVDELAGFLGTVDAATQWLPILVLVALRPILRRWGAGVAVMIFPVAILLATGALTLLVTLPVAVIARGSSNMFRYSAERAGREILYVPVPDNIKLRAKAYIDVALEKGVGKALSGLVILVLVLATGSMTVVGRLVVLGFLGIGAALALLLVFLKVRREYVTSLAKSIDGRFASLRGTYVPLIGPGPRRMVREALADPNPLKVAFALDLIEQGEAEDTEPFAADLMALLDHPSADLRRRALEIMARSPESVDEARIRDRLTDDDATVRERAANVLAAGAGDSAHDLFTSLLEDSDWRVRAAALACLRDTVAPDEAAGIAAPFVDSLVQNGVRDDSQARLELATAAGLVPDAEGVGALVLGLMEDEDPAVARAAIGSAARLGTPDLIAAVIEALGSPRGRSAAREGLAARGDAVLPELVAALNARTTPPAVRRNIPGVLGDIPTESTMDALIHSYMLPETEQVLDNRALAALSKLRAGDTLTFPTQRVLEVVGREVEAANRYSAAALTVGTLPDSPVIGLIVRALEEASTERREALFRWLGLLYPQNGMYRSYLAIESGEDRPRANALEWLESTTGHALYTSLAPALTPGDRGSEAPAGAVLRELWSDEDVWLARLALWGSFTAGPERTVGELESFEPGDPGLQRTVQRIRTRHDGTVDPPTGVEEHDMDLIEKVFLLQNVDLLQGVRSQQLALLASIATQVEADAGRVLLTRDEPTDAMYVVISGEVQLEGVGDHTISVSEGKAFGTWALVDRDPSLLAARTTTDCRLLRIQRSDFQDLLVDHPELGLDLLNGLAKRFRSLATAPAAQA